MFDIITTNPPFQDLNNKGKTQHKIWLDFTIMEIDKLLKNGGFLLQVSPSSFLSPSSKILKYFKKYNTEFIDLDTKVYFPKVGSTFASYKIVKDETIKNSTTIIQDMSSFETLIDDNTFYLPNDVSEHSISIHKKVIFDTTEKLKVKFDYVTAHNILLKKTDKLSKCKTKEHIYPILHTNAQIWYTREKQEWSDIKKVMWSRSGYTRPFYDPGTLGGTDMCYYIQVKNDTQGKNLESVLRSKLFTYVLKTAKWSGFGNEKVFLNLPTVDLTKAYTDNDLYKIFNISNEEIEYIENISASSKIQPSLSFLDNDSRWKMIADQMNKHEYMGEIDRDTVRVKQTAEVFTPTECVLYNIYTSGVEHYGHGKTVLDPACGDGQWLYAVKLVKMLFHNMKEEDALSDIYGCDLQSDNVMLCKKRLSNNNINLLGIVDSNIVNYDSLKYNYRFDGSHPYDEEVKEQQKEELFNSLFD